MGKLHSQLALYGSIDDEVVSRDDPRTTEIVERFLPGTTGYGQRGWYRELRTFIDRLAPSGSVQFPTRDEAILDLAGQVLQPLGDRGNVERGHHSSNLLGRGNVLRPIRLGRRSQHVG